ncbi:hypothetical protein [Nesterenkonia muleiensis]|uniref:hypothetical protein n=1 Tax=Nesterenkonia muleiensis TaxID=2282648 RepID=UPI000E71D772|nr:hypothetical protein [Nesterenkonia muleiensis]
MATTDNKLRSIAAVLGIGSLALVGVTACDNGDTTEEPDNGVENGDDGLEDDGLEDDGMDEEDEG